MYVSKLIVSARCSCCSRARRRWQFVNIRRAISVSWGHSRSLADCPLPRLEPLFLVIRPICKQDVSGSNPLGSAQTKAQVRDDSLTWALIFRRSQNEPLPGDLDQLAFHTDGAGVEVDIPALTRRYLSPSARSGER